MDVLIVMASYLLPVIASILALLLAVGSKKLMDKWGIERSEKIDNMIDNYVSKGVNVAEVAGRKYLAMHGQKLLGTSKKARAVQVVMDELKQSGITKVAEQLVVSRIESWLEVDGKKPGIPSDPQPASTGEAT